MLDIINLPQRGFPFSIITLQTFQVLHSMLKKSPSVMVIFQEQEHSLFAPGTRFVLAVKWLAIKGSRNLQELKYWLYLYLCYEARNTLHIHFNLFPPFWHCILQWLNLNGNSFFKILWSVVENVCVCVLLLFLCFVWR